MSEAKDTAPREVDPETDADLKIILLGDSAVGKSKLIERYLMDEYNPRQLSTYALTLFRKEVQLEDEGGSGVLGKKMVVDFWDTAGQESFNRMHPSYYYRAHCCLLLFDVTRKMTYQHLADWYKELREYCENIPVVLVANKIDVDYNVTRKEFKFAAKHDLPFFFVSAADGTNVVKVFETAVREAIRFKESGGDLLSDMLDFLSEKEVPRSLGPAGTGSDSKDGEDAK